MFMGIIAIIDNWLTSGTAFTALRTTFLCCSSGIMPPQIVPSRTLPHVPTMSSLHIWKIGYSTKALVGVLSLSSDPLAGRRVMNSEYNVRQNT